MEEAPPAPTGGAIEGFARRDDSLERFRDSPVQRSQTLTSRWWPTPRIAPVHVVICAHGGGRRTIHRFLSCTDVHVGELRAKAFELGLLLSRFQFGSQGFGT